MQFKYETLRILLRKKSMTQVISIVLFITSFIMCFFNKNSIKSEKPLQELPVL